MAFLNFRLQPGNELEKGGRTNPPAQADESEPEKNCPNCHKDIPISKILANDNVCTCGYHFRMGARQRIKFIVDTFNIRKSYVCFWPFFINNSHLSI